MSEWAVFLSWVMLVALVTFHESAEATPTPAQDRNRVVTTYNSWSDRCKHIEPGSMPEAKAAADSFCKQAFEALDRLEGNSCEGWYNPECRQFPEHGYSLCSCQIPPPENSKVKGLRFSTFHDCAWQLKQEEANKKKAPAPSDSYKSQHAKIQKKAEKRANAWRTGKTPSEAEETTDSEEERYFQRNVGKRLLEKKVGKFADHYRVVGGGASGWSSSDSSGDEAESGGQDSGSIVSGVKNLWGRFTSRNEGSSTASTAAGKSKRRQKTREKRP